MAQDLGREDVVGLVSGLEEVAAVPVGGKLHTVNPVCMYVFLERLAQCIPFEVLDQKRDGVGAGPCFAAVVAGPESVGVVSLTNKRAVGFGEFLYRRSLNSRVRRQEWIR